MHCVTRTSSRYRVTVIEWHHTAGHACTDFEQLHEISVIDGQQHLVNTSMLTRRCFCRYDSVGGLC